MSALLPVDPRLLRCARPARMFLVALAWIGAADALLLVSQATSLADLVAALVLVAPHARVALPPGAAAGLITATAGRAALAWLREACAARTATAVKSGLRADLLCRLVRGPVTAADRTARTGELALLATTGVDALDGYFARYLPQFALAVIVPAVLGARILSADRVSAVVIAATLPLVPLFMVLIALKTRGHLVRRWGSLERLGGHFLEVVAGLPTLVAFGRARRQAVHIRRAADAHRRATLATLRIAFLSALALELIALTSVALVAVALGLRLASGRLDLRTGLMVLICAPEVYLPLRQLGARYHEAADGLGAADRVLAELASPAPVAGSATVADPAGAEIRFERVRLVRDGRAADVLGETSFVLCPGRVTAVTGPSGAGKSTLIRVLLGFDRPSSGRVTVDGVDLAELDPARWRAEIAWVPQRPRLTGATVAEAIRLGSPGASADRVEEAARIAGIDFPLGTRLGRDGTALSGGQARRVALARAVLRDAPIVLLDEPTEHLDAASEGAITGALRSWLVGRTVLLVTHRHALLSMCDTVIRLDGARRRERRVLGAIPTQGPVKAEVPRRRAPWGEPTGEGEAAGNPAGGASAGPGARRRSQAPAMPRRRHAVLGAVLLGAAAAAAGIGLAAASAWLIAASALRPPVLTLQVGIAAVQAFAFGRAGLRYAERLAGHDATLRLLTELRVRVFRGLVRRAPAGLSAERGGDLLATLTADIDAVQDLFLKALLPIAGMLSAAAALLAFDLLLAPRCALALGVGVLAALVLGPALTAYAARRAERRTQAARARLADGAVDLLNALPDLVAYGGAEQQAARIARDDRALCGLERRGALGSGAGIALVGLASGVTCAYLAIVARDAVAAGRLTGPLAAAVVLAPLALFELLGALPDAARAISRGSVAHARLGRLASAPPLIPVPAQPTRLAWTAASVLELDGVEAAWPGAHGSALRDLSLRLRAGEQAALAGPSGAGKSTLAHLLARGLDPVRGTVRIDGVDLRDVHPEQVRRLVAVFGQDAHLFDASIRENLRIGRPDASEAELWDALRVVCLERWTRALPAGIDTPVGALGDAVSGGEAQRVALARMLLSPAPVLVLDEPTAHLDAVTARTVEANLRRALHGRTVLWLRHQDVGVG